MKTNLTISLVVVCLTFAANELAANELAAQEKKGGILHGVVESVNGNTITVNYRRKSRPFTLTDKLKINYVSFLKAKKDIQPGFVIRAHVDSKGQCHQIWVTLSPPAAPVQGRLQGPPAKSKFLAVSNKNNHWTLDYSCFPTNDLKNNA